MALILGPKSALTGAILLGQVGLGRKFIAHLQTVLADQGMNPFIKAIDRANLDIL